MAAFSAIAMAAIAAGSSGYKIYQGAKDKREAREEMDSLAPPELDNSFKDIPISTAGSDIIREEGQRTTANLIDASRAGGTRSVMSSIPKIAALNNRQNTLAAKNIDDQIINRDYAIAGGENQIKRLKENRYLGEIQGLGALESAGRQNIWSGIQGLGATAGYLSRAIDSNSTDDGITPDKYSSTFRPMKLDNPFT